MNLVLLKNESSSDEIKNLSDKDLILRVTSLVRQERQIIEGLIWHLKEVQDRNLYLSLGYISLHDCLVKHFGYSGAAAYAKLSALKIISAVPEAAEALNQGEVTLTTLSLAQSFIRRQEQESGTKVSTENKIELLQTIKNKTTQEVKQTLAEMNPAMDLPHDKINYLTAKDVQLQITTDKELLAKIEKLKFLISHEDVNPSYSKLLHMALDAVIQKKENEKGFKVKKEKITTRALSIGKSFEAPEHKTTQRESIKSQRTLHEDTTVSTIAKRTISRSVKRKTLERSQGRCEFIHTTGQRCNSNFQLQFDHIKAFSKGGTSDQENIQNLCRVHNSHKSFN